MNIENSKPGSESIKTMGTLRAWWDNACGRTANCYWATRFVHRALAHAIPLLLLTEKTTNVHAHFFAGLQYMRRKWPDAQSHKLNDKCVALHDAVLFLHISTRLNLLSFFHLDSLTVHNECLSVVPR